MKDPALLRPKRARVHRKSTLDSSIEVFPVFAVRYDGHVVLLSQVAGLMVAICDAF